MNKAFTKEADSSDQPPRCPRCGSAGPDVGADTLSAHVSPDLRRRIADRAFFCPSAHCDVVYFDALEQYILAEQLDKGVYPKDPDAPLCGCFGLTRDDIELDIEEGTPRRVRELLQRAQTPEARCVRNNVSGQCCVGDVQRYYLKRRAEFGPRS